MSAWRGSTSRACARASNGVIINIIGAGGEKLSYGYIAGAAGNASLMAFSRALGGQSPDFGVRVIGINPGPVATERFEYLARQRAKKAGDESKWRDGFAHMPFRRPATVDEIAATVVFLASDLVRLHQRHRRHHRRRHDQPRRAAVSDEVRPWRNSHPMS